MIGSRTQKVLDFKVRCKHCRTCETAERNKKNPKPHTCAKNWTGSAKSMEPSMGVDMCKNLTGINILIFRQASHIKISI
jgi:hypothetical protein